jgi:hypothetical protein
LRSIRLYLNLLIKDFDSFDQIAKILPSLKIVIEILLFLSPAKDQKKLKLLLDFADSFFGQHN